MAQDLEKTVARQPAFRDRRTGLVLCGAALILVGGFCAMLALFLGLLLLDVVPTPPGQPAASAQDLLPGLVVYLFAAVLFVTLGVGSIVVRRWARALVLVTSWLWLFAGVTALLATLTFVPGMFEAMSKSGASGTPPPVSVGALVAISAFTVVLLLVLPPLGFILFFSDRDVTATVESRDPIPRWTDRNPLPVLGLALVLACWGASLLALCAAFPLVLFGKVVTGPGAALAWAALGIVVLLLAWGAWNRKRLAWWGTLAVTLTQCASGFVTMASGHMVDVYRATGMPDDQVALIEPLLRAPAFLGVMALATAGVIGWLIWARRWFDA